MAWSRFEDDMDDNPKVLSYSDKAFRLWACSITFTTRNRSKGFMTTDQARALARKIGATPQHIAELVKKRGWEQLEEGLLVHDYDDYHPKDPTAAERNRAYRSRNAPRNSDRHGAVTESSRSRDPRIPNPESRITPPTPLAGVTVEDPNPEPEFEMGGSPEDGPPELWAAVVEKIPAHLRGYLDHAQELEHAGGKLVIGVPNPTIARRLSDNCTTSILNALAELMPNPPELVLEIAPNTKGRR